MARLNYTNIPKLAVPSVGDSASVIFMESHPIHPLFVDKFRDSESEVAYHYTSDVALLFNQQRIENISVDVVNNWINGLNHTSSKVDELRAKCTDEELKNIVKSRYIQSPAALKSWVESLDEDMQSIVDEYRSSMQSTSSVDDPSASSEP